MVTRCCDMSVAVLPGQWVVIVTSRCEMGEAVLLGQNVFHGLKSL